MIGENLRALRTRQALSQKDLAERAGVDMTTVYRIEAGRTQVVRPSTVRRLAEALGVTPETLITSQPKFRW